MSTLVSVDQSLSHCAIVVFKDGVVIDRRMVRTGSTSSKGTRKASVQYFDTVTEQIYHVACGIYHAIVDHKADDFVMEALSFGSAGNATRDLAGLFYAVQVLLFSDGIFGMGAMHTVAPTSVKAFARDFLPLEDQKITKERVDKKTGKKVYSSVKNPMKKPQMVEACEMAMPGWLDGLTLEAGKADYADAYFIGRCFLEAKSRPAKGK